MLNSYFVMEPHHGHHHQHDFGFDFNAPISQGFNFPRPNLDLISSMIETEEAILKNIATNGLQTVLGFVKGFVERNDLKNMEACADDLESIEKEIEEIIPELQSLDPTQIVDAVQKLIKIVQDALGDVDTCKAMNTDLQKVEDWAKNVVSHPTSIVNHVLMHIGGIITAIKDATADAASGDMEKLGDDMAEICVDVFGKVDEKYTYEAINWDLVY